MIQNSAFETNTALFLPTHDKRYVFVGAMAKSADDWHDRHALFRRYRASAAYGRRNRLLNFGGQHLRGKTNQQEDVIAAWAGLRPLIGAEFSDNGKSNTANLSREHEIIEFGAGMVSLMGGKLTNYRLMG